MYQASRGLSAIAELLVKLIVVTVKTVSYFAVETVWSYFQTFCHNHRVESPLLKLHDLRPPSGWKLNVTGNFYFYRTAGYFKREDLARTVLSYIIEDLVSTTQLVCECHDIKRVFYSGGFCSTPLVRSIITAEYVRRNVLRYLQGQVNVLFWMYTNGSESNSFGLCSCVHIQSIYVTACNIAFITVIILFK